MNHFANLWKVTLVLSICSVSPLAATPDILLTVDDSKLSDVIVSATGNSPLVSNAAHNYVEGVDLIDVFTTNATGEFDYSDLSSSLTTTLAPDSSYNSDAADNLFVANSSPTGPDLNLFNYATGGANETFQVGTAAFSGSMSIDLASFNTPVEAYGYIGDIYAGYSSDKFGNGPAVLIGQFEIIPEPGTLAFSFLGISLLTGWHLLKRKPWLVRRSV